MLADLRRFDCPIAVGQRIAAVDPKQPLTSDRYSEEGQGNHKDYDKDNYPNQFSGSEEALSSRDPLSARRLIKD